MTEFNIPDAFCRIYVEDGATWDILYEAYDSVREAIKRYVEGDEDVVIEAQRVEGGTVTVPTSRIVNLATMTVDSRHNVMVWNALVRKEQAEVLRERGLTNYNGPEMDW